MPKMPKSSCKCLSITYFLGRFFFSLALRANKVLHHLEQANRDIILTTLMPPPHVTLAKPRSCSKNTAFTPSVLSSAEPSWQMMWPGLKVEVLSLKHRPSHQYLDMRQECRTYKSVASRPCDWLFLVLAMRAWGAPLTKTDGKIDE